MTKISYIAGIGQDESAQRAVGIKPQPFIPYLSMTQGEMSLALMQEQANILAGFYGTPKYRQAEAMLENALYRGIHGSTPYMGAYDPALTGIVKAINQARRETRPASSAAFYRPQGMMNGIHVGEPIIDYESRGKACRQWAESANHKSERKRRIKVCEQTWRIEKILNDGVEKSGQYLAYGYLPKNNNLPQNANLKIFSQNLAQYDIARVGKIDITLTQQWLNVGMMRNNAQVAKIKPYGWDNTNAILMALPEAGQKEVLALFAQVKNKADKMSGLKPMTEAEVGNKLAAIVKKYQGVNGIGDPISVTLLIIGAVTALIGAISKFASSIKNEQIDAFAQVNGFGGRPFGPEEGDWDQDGIPDNVDTTPKGATDYTTPLLLAGGGLLAWQLLK